ncbi:Heterokaryon incompatibility protein [Hyphodiscus hymeniophilus]|uniref:Heterokaryon incompatibility protein n=1 Tax=Hyphodiscus hymeniophilus TaxID=353542 RepID=A0A9P6SL46_9HELO|nr:Heterokaryon incompatibility protein [Hyphodiscus hymeniophilus]
MSSHQSRQQPAQNASFDGPVELQENATASHLRELKTASTPVDTIKTTKVSFDDQVTGLLSRVDSIHITSPPHPEQSAVSTSLYKYSPLRYIGSIRLLTIHPGSGFEPIEIKLFEVRSRALRRLRHHEKERVLWVDAICIDQEDDKERGHQVGLMCKIYSKAHQVLIWLGEKSQDVDARTGRAVSDLYLEHVGTMAMQMRKLQAHRKPPTSSLIYKQIISDMEDKLLTSKGSALLRSLFYIHDRPWWERVWVLQEAALSKNALLICSSKTANYSDLILFYDVLSRDRAARTLLAPMRGLRVIFRTSRTHLSSVRWVLQGTADDNLSLMLLRILNNARHLKATDPRDIIYGILGLCPAFSKVLPDPDYSRTPSKVLVEVAKGWINYSQSLDILAELHAQDLASSHPSYYLYKAARWSKAICEFHDNSTELRAKGKPIDWVQNLSFTVGAWDMTKPREKLSGWKDSCLLGSSLAKYHTGENILDVLWRTLCCNTDINYAYPAPSHVGREFRKWHTALTSGVSIENIATGMSTGDDDELKSFVWLRKQPLCVTVGGLMASVPEMTEVGDRIVLLSGSNVPFVVRPVDDYHRMTGPCYVHGIMNGEAWPAEENDLEWFSIR